jgi:hypothetical protein
VNDENGAVSETTPFPQGWDLQKWKHLSKQRRFSNSSITETDPLLALTSFKNDGNTRIDSDCAIAETVEMTAFLLLPMVCYAD